MKSESEKKNKKCKKNRGKITQILASAQAQRTLPKFEMSNEQRQLDNRLS